MRIAAVGDVHGREYLAAFLRDLDALGNVDLLLLAGDITERNDIDAFGKVLGAVRARVRAPVWAVFGNNEYADDYPTYRERFADPEGVRFLEDESATFVSVEGDRIRVVGSMGSLDRPTWWQRKNMPHLAGEYERRIATLDRLLEGDDPRLLLTHYPPTYATMGDEKEAWRPELGCRALEAVVLRRRPDLVVHGHVHKGIPYAELGSPRRSLEAFAENRSRIPVYNVAYPVRRAIAVLDV
jgi:Icc-related predicted phosphoesterase